VLTARWRNGLRGKEGERRALVELLLVFFDGLMAHLVRSYCSAVYASVLSVIGVRSRFLRILRSNFVDFSPMKTLGCCAGNKRARSHGHINEHLSRVGYSITP